PRSRLPHCGGFRGRDRGCLPVEGQGKGISGMTTPKTMLAAICTGYGGPEKVVVAERPVPVPKDNEVLVKIAATTVNSGDARIRGFNVPRGFGLIMRMVFGVKRPRSPVLGTELSGTVVATGKSVSRF